MAYGFQAETVSRWDRKSDIKGSPAILYIESGQVEDFSCGPAIAWQFSGLVRVNTSEGRGFSSYVFKVASR